MINVKRLTYIENTNAKYQTLWNICDDRSRSRPLNAIIDSVDWAKYDEDTWRRA